MKLSVIIPIYCVEATLDRCVKSVLGQQVDDMEVILVDDGSPDRCPQMCDEWARKDHRVRVVHKENGGLSDARNAGLDIAQGDFVTFVDSDDWVADNTYPPLLEQMGNNDLLEYSIADRLQLGEHCYEDTGEYWLKEQAYAHTYACNKIYRKKLFANVRYPKGRIFEDVYTLPSLLKRAKKVATTPLGSYHYTWNPKGITATADGQGLAQLLEAHLRSDMPMDDTYYIYLVNIQIDVKELTGAPVTLPARKVKVGKVPQRYRIKALLLNIFGINTLCRIFKTIHQIRRPSHS